MITLTDSKKCTGCSACHQICPTGALEMKENHEGFLYPVINKETCVSCKKCERVCPVINATESIRPAAVYAARAKDEEIVSISSSGGMFGTLARHIINNGGVVFGAGYDKDFKVIHKSAQTTDELTMLMGSKYVQSDIKNTYKEVREQALAGRQVLFAGTPCQCAGLAKFMEKEYPNLILADFVCHGVPSPALYKKYLEYMSRDKEIARVRFRDKTTEKKSGHYISIEYKDNYVYRVPSVEDPYMLAFLQNISLRESCSDCCCKNFKSGSDLTIGDFWGLSQTDSPLKDKDGVSLLCVNTEKGGKIFEEISLQADSDLRTLEEALGENKSIVSSVRKNPLREKFLRDMNKMDIKKLECKYCGNSFGAKLKRLIAKI